MTNKELQEKLKQFPDDARIGLALYDRDDATFCNMGPLDKAIGPKPGQAAVAPEDNVVLLKGTRFAFLPKIIPHP